VLVADDHPAVLHGLAGILRSTPDIKVVALCNDGAAAIEAVRKFEPDVAVLDIRMPQVNGLEALPKIIDVTKVVFLTATASEKQLLEAIAGGAKGIVLKEYASDRLIDCIRTVATGQCWFPPELIGVLKSELGHKLTNQDFESLTMRERTVVLMVSKGNSNKQVARQLGLSEATVKIHCGGPEVLNRISASISGTSAGVMLPRGAAAS
jgi:two-component system NarL family response regulator/two-component system nitrate/nitrite response regulator NarL